MGLSLTYKILKNHLVHGDLTAGNEIAVRIDQTLTQDATGTMAYLQFEAMSIPRLKTRLTVSYVDHNMLQEGFENFDDHRYLMTAARKFGAFYSRAGNGICHQVHLERFGVPGTTLLGSDSHTPTGGGLGQIAIGAGGLDVAVAMGGGPFWMTCPKVVQVHLTGKLQPFVSAKDIILEVLRILTTKGNVGTIIEYTGPGVKSLSVPERGTVCNMGAEVGVTTSLFPSDDQTKRYLNAQGRGKSYKAFAADKDATYDRTIEIDLDELEPMIARPQSPDNIDKVKNLKGEKVQQALIGTCVNSSILDLTSVATILKGRKVAPWVSFGVTPGSRQALRMATQLGYMDTFIAAGARILESACGFCIGVGQAPGTGVNSVRTGNRNFAGRSGTKDDRVFLASPETTAASALAGEFIDPRELPKRFGVRWKRPALPKKYLIDDSEILPPAPAAKADGVEIIRGPNIGAPPMATPLPASIQGDVLIKVGDKITTDHIMPAGARMKYRSNVPKYSEFVFEIFDPQFHSKAKAVRDAGRHGLIVGGESYGQGSSREHAALCPMYLGIRAVLVKSMERIHKANLINFGILPITFVDPKSYDAIDRGDKLSLPDVSRALGGASNRMTVRNETRGTSFEIQWDLTQRQKDILLAGGLLNYTRMTSERAAKPESPAA